MVNRSESPGRFVCTQIGVVIAYRRAAEGNPFLSFPPWLPLWGSCHEVTERVKTPFPPLRGTWQGYGLPHQRCDAGSQ